MIKPLTVSISYICSRLCCMGARRHGQEGALALPLEMFKVFCALVVTAKRSVDELFMHYFHNLSSASGGEDAQTPTGYPWTHWGTVVPRSLICPPLEKILRVPMLCCQIVIAFGAGLTVENGRMLIGRRNVAKISSNIFNESFFSLLFVRHTVKVANFQICR